jgi:hypothetical protein
LIKYLSKLAAGTTSEEAVKFVGRDHIVISHQGKEKPQVPG